MANKGQITRSSQKRWRQTAKMSHFLKGRKFQRPFQQNKVFTKMNSSLIGEGCLKIALHKLRQLFTIGNLLNSFLEGSNNTAIEFPPSKFRKTCGSFLNCASTLAVRLATYSILRGKGGFESLPILHCPWAPQQIFGRPMFYMHGNNKRLRPSKRTAAWNF